MRIGDSNSDSDDNSSEKSQTVLVDASRIHSLSQLSWERITSSPPDINQNLFDDQRTKDEDLSNSILDREDSAPAISEADREINNNFNFESTTSAHGNIYADSNHRKFRRRSSASLSVNRNNNNRFSVWNNQRLPLFFTATEARRNRSGDATIPTLQSRRDAEYFRLKKARERDIRLFRHPVRTLQLFFMLVYGWRVSVANAIQSMMRWGLPVAFFSVLTICTANEIIGPPARFAMKEIGLWISSITWWVILGALSSIGLGSGIHSGILFLIPHCILISSTAEYCNSLDFDPRVNSWGSVLSPGDIFTCQPQSSKLFNINVTPLNLLLKMIPYAFCWGFGTALGELPPYGAAFATAHAALNEQTGHDDNLPDFIIADETNTTWFSRLKRLIFFILADFIGRYGSLSVFLLSSWPNALFDLCGIICGYNRMPFWHFFIPLCLGKAVVKIIAQTSILIFVFSKHYDATRAQWIPRIARLPPISSWVKYRYGNDFVQFEETMINKMIQMRKSFVSPQNLTPPEINYDGYFDYFSKRFLTVPSFSSVFSFVLTVIVIHFIVTAIEQGARTKQQEFDSAYLRGCEWTSPSDEIEFGSHKLSKNN